MSTYLKVEDISSSKFVVDGFWYDIEDWEPPEPGNLDFHVDLTIGTVGDESISIFYLNIKTDPDKLNRERVLEDYLFEKDDRTLLVREYEGARVKKIIEMRVRDCDRGNWPDSLECLRSYFWWEYDNFYDPDAIN